jgi:hypothetical protein
MQYRRLLLCARDGVATRCSATWDPFVSRGRLAPLLGSTRARCTNLALALSLESSKINHLYRNAIGTPVAYNPQWVRRRRRTGIPPEMPLDSSEQATPAQRILYGLARHTWFTPSGQHEHPAPRIAR